jgi:hypothetical protein
MLPLFCSTALAQQTTITFQVDMSVAIQNSLFNSATQTVQVWGSYNGWSTGNLMTNNPSASNTNLYTGAVVNTNVANGGVIDWQYRLMSGTTVDTYSSQADTYNYCATLPATAGTLAPPLSFFSDDGAAVTNNVTFQVDMSEQINLGSFVPGTNVLYCQGSFEGWNDNFPLTNNPAISRTNAQGVVTHDVYVGTYPVTASPGAAEEFKYVISTSGANSYESPTTGDPDQNNNRFFQNVAQTLPIVYYSDAPFLASVTNNVTFEVDMSVQAEVGNFGPFNTVEMHGDFDSWGTPLQMTNNPSASNTNIYSGVAQFIGPPGTQHYYKYVIQPGTEWETVSGTATNETGSGGNRWFDLASTNASFVVGPVYYSDQGSLSLYDVITTNDSATPFTVAMVTFTVNMTNAHEYTTSGPGTAFDPTVNLVYINGLNNGFNNTWWSWGGLGNAAYQMYQISNSWLYNIQIPVNLGQPLDVTYKYSIDGSDNEAGFNDNHTRYIRSLPDYTMPVDVFGGQGSATSTEPSFGDFSAQAGKTDITLTWLGRPYVHLESSPNLGTTAVWTPAYNTDGTNLLVAPGGMATTNYPMTGPQKFFRLVYP